MIHSTNLESLSMHDMRSDNFNGLRNLPKLKTLDLSRVTLTGLLEIAKYSQITSLSLQSIKKCQMMLTDSCVCTISSVPPRVEVVNTTLRKLNLYNINEDLTEWTIGYTYPSITKLVYPSFHEFNMLTSFDTTQIFPLVVCSGNSSPT